MIKSSACKPMPQHWLGCGSWFGGGLIFCNGGELQTKKCCDDAGLLDVLFGVTTLIAASIGSLASFSSAALSGDCGMDWDVSTESFLQARCAEIIQGLSLEKYLSEMACNNFQATRAFEFAPFPSFAPM